jgi:hypothetical protein
VSISRASRHLQTLKISNLQIIAIFSYIQVEEVAVMGAVMGPVVAMEEMEVMVGLRLEALLVVVVVVVAIIRMVAHMAAEVVDIQEETMEDMVGVATVVMEGEEDMEEAVAMVAVDMVDMVDQDMGVVQEVPMEETASMEEQGGLADRFHGVMMVTVLGR